LYGNKKNLWELVPAEIELDTFQGKTYVSVVCFRMEQIRPIHLPAVGFLSNFYEINVRTYVKKGDKAGVYFLNIEAEKAFKNAFKYSLNGQYLYDRSRALMGLKKYKEAIEVLLQSRRISEQEGDVTDGEDMELVRCYIGLKDKKNAEKYLELAREGADNVADEFIDEYEEELDQLEDMIDEL